MFVTVLFLPITETLISIVECHSGDGEDGTDPNLLYLDAFEEIICWQGWHLVHASIATFFNFSFIIIASTVALTYFEPRMLTSDRTARIVIHYFWNGIYYY